MGQASISAHANETVATDEGWVREGRRQLEQHRWRHPDPILRSPDERSLARRPTHKQQRASQ